MGVFDSTDDLDRDYDSMRGIANNNPGNVRKTAIVWEGQSDLQTDPSFVQFKSPEYGFRCMARILKTHYARGEQTITALITAWAPSTENDTAGYIEDVSQRSGIGPLAVLVFPDDLFNLLFAICWHENGYCPYDAAVIEKGIQLEES